MPRKRWGRFFATGDTFIRDETGQGGDEILSTLSLSSTWDSADLARDDHGVECCIGLTPRNRHSQIGNEPLAHTADIFACVLDGIVETEDALVA